MLSLINLIVLNFNYFLRFPSYCIFMGKCIVNILRKIKNFSRPNFSQLAFYRQRRTNQINQMVILLFF